LEIFPGSFLKNKFNLTF